MSNRDLVGHTSPVIALACTPDGATLASSSYDETVRLWRLSDGSCTAVLKGHTSAVRALACTPDGATLASGSWDKTVRLWRLADNTCTAVLEGHTGVVWALACTPDGAILASGSTDKTVRLWRLSDCICTAILEECPNGIYALAFTPNGKTLSVSRCADVLLVDTVLDSRTQTEGEECFICYNSTHLQPICVNMHRVCLECITQLRGESRCPYCRQNMLVGDVSFRTIEGISK